MECREVREYLPAYSDPDGAPRSDAVDNHLETCAECRGELVQYRTMNSDLITLSEQSIEPPSWLLGTLTETVVEKAEQIAIARELRRQLTDPKIVGGALLAAGVAGVIFVGSRRRKKRTIGRRLREAIAEA